MAKGVRTGDRSDVAITKVLARYNQAKALGLSPIMCINWTGSVVVEAAGGYGRAHVNGKRVGAHRYVYELLVGAIPGGMEVAHRCDRPTCCNPEHLTLATRQENHLDMIEKGRHAHGERHRAKLRQVAARGEDQGAHVLTEEQVRELRELRRLGWRVADLASRYGVCKATISYASRGLSWAHVA